MRAVDTTIIVRYLTADHPTQSPKARALVDRDEIFVGTAVLLETEWVLRIVYEYSSLMVADALTGFAGLPTVTMEEPAVAAQALDWSRQGLDFADALHLAKAAGCADFVTFDRTLAKRAHRMTDVVVRTP